MKIDLERFGLKDVPVDPDTVFTFAVGPAGFPDCRRFKVFHQEGPQPAVFWLQSLDDVAVAFPIVDPGLDLEYWTSSTRSSCPMPIVPSSNWSVPKMRRW
ncbi:MAG: flagellar assembly protein FliW [Accumulibacter sp.]|jgi:flagellar assembly factor FliW|uniref:flagellar assembly protein FliW n=1 Tax=Accumulibacter sp. TaxID=2053492 RepID=UPI002FC27F22